MARRRASMREGPLAELFKATEAAQRQAEQEQVGEGEAASGSQLPIEEAPTVESVAPLWAMSVFVMLNAATASLWNPPPALS